MGPGGLIGGATVGGGLWSVGPEDSGPGGPKGWVEPSGRPGGPGMVGTVCRITGCPGMGENIIIFTLSMLSKKI